MRNYYTIDVVSLLHVSAYDVCSVINSHIYISNCWFCSRHESYCKYMVMKYLKFF